MNLHPELFDKMRVPMDLHPELFDKIRVPIILCGGGAWGSENNIN